MRTSSLLTLGALTFASTAQAQFGPGTSYSPGQQPDGVALADFDGDGDRDIAVSTDAPDKISVFTNAGGGTFTGPTFVFLGNGTSPQHLVARDFDGDGDVDLAVALKNVNSVQLVLNAGGGVFVPGPMVGTAGDEPRQLAAGDLDGDGDMDVIASNRKSNTVSVLLNSGGSFALLGTFAAGQEPRKLATADFDGDGDVDVAVSSQDDRTIRILNNGGSGTLTPGPVLSVGGQVRPDGLAAADLDGNGMVDLAAATSGNNGALNFATVFLNTGGWSGPFHYDTGGLNPDDVAAADLENDGDVDLVLSNQDSNTVAALANTGGGTFGAPTLFGTGTRPGDVELADLDGNGSPDLVVADRDSHDIMVYANMNDFGGGCTFVNYCNPGDGNPGNVATISASGCELGAPQTVDAAGVPANQNGYLIVGSGQGTASPNQGTLCVIGTCIGRYAADVQNSGGTGTFSTDISNSMSGGPNFGLPAACSGSIQSGETWYFQYWHRLAGGGDTFSEAIGITFQ